MGNSVFSRRGARLAAVLAAAVGALGLQPSGASAATVARVSISGSTAYARFENVDGCTRRSASVLSADGQTRDNLTGRTSSSTIYLSIFDYNECDGTSDYAYGQADLAPKAFTVRGDLGLASLSATVSVYDYNSAQTRSVQVNLTWSASGDPRKGSDSSRYRYADGTMTLYRSSGVFHPAVASGGIVDGTLDWTAGAQSINAEIDSVNSGDLTITR